MSVLRSTCMGISKDADINSRSVSRVYHLLTTLTAIIILRAQRSIVKTLVLSAPKCPQPTHSAVIHIPQQALYTQMSDTQCTHPIPPLASAPPRPLERPPRCIRVISQACALRPPPCPFSLAVSLSSFASVIFRPFNSANRRRKISTLA